MKIIALEGERFEIFIRVLPALLRVVDDQYVPHNCKREEMDAAIVERARSITRIVAKQLNAEDGL